MMQRTPTRIACGALCLLLQACGYNPLKRIEIPVPVACVLPEKLPQRPALVTDAELAGASNGVRTRALLVYQERAEPYIRDLETIARQCSRVK